MCIAIYKPQGAQVTKDALHRSFTANSDGAGYVFAHKGKLTIKKGFFTFKAFWKEYRQDMIELDNPVALIHFRITTHGLTNAENCHPFSLGKDFAMIHNGIIDCAMPDKEMSDTHNFAKYVLKPLVQKFGKRVFDSKEILELIGMGIGASKIAILSSNGEVNLVNSEYGAWEHGVWYSNDSYKPRETKSRYTYYQKRGGWDVDDFDYGYTTDRVVEVVKKDSKTEPSKVEDMVKIFKKNTGQPVPSIDLSKLKGRSLEEIAELEEDDFFGLIETK
jgi:predicted glutamine amidotransferase